ncbi:MAG: hypothetical protein KBA60_02895 [Flavobacteriales bacterium]|nr:hypothetical protein [Flavobacteriales bacterium]MBP7154930.1 hypothetical protein [Flavobacteriales bacterium]
MIQKFLIGTSADLDHGPSGKPAKASLVPEHTDVRAIRPMDATDPGTIVPFDVQDKACRIFFDPSQVSIIITIKEINHLIPNRSWIGIGPRSNG